MRNGRILNLKRSFECVEHITAKIRNTHKPTNTHVRHAKDCIQHLLTMQMFTVFEQFFFRFVSYSFGIFRVSLCFCIIATDPLAAKLISGLIQILLNSIVLLTLHFDNHSYRSVEMLDGRQCQSIAKIYRKPATKSLFTFSLFCFRFFCALARLIVPITFIVNIDRRNSQVEQRRSSSKMRFTYVMSLSNSILIL